MARVFDNASTQYLNGAAPVTGTPCTMVSWAYPTASANSFILHLSNYTDNITVYRASGNLYIQHNTSFIAHTAFALNAWHFIGGVFSSNSSRFAYIDGSASTVNTSLMSPSGNITDFYVGKRWLSGQTAVPYGGRLAHTAIWNVALSVAELDAMYAGIDPRTIRPDALVAYYPFISRDSGQDVDWWGNYNLTPYGSPTSTTDDPPVQMSSGLWVPWQVAGAAGGDVDVTIGDVSAASSIVGPTILLGSLNVTIGNVSAASSITGPTIAFGSVSVTIGDVSAASSITGPTVVAGSATPVIEQTNTSTTGSDSTTHSVALPASIASGDLLIVAFANDGTATASVTTPATGWTQLFTQQTSFNFARLTVFYRWADGGEGSAITITTSSSEQAGHVSYRISGADTGTNPEYGTASTGNSTSPDPPSLNPTGWDVENTMWIAVMGHDQGWSVSAFPLAGSQVSAAGGTSLGATVAMCAVVAGQASYDPGTFTTASSDWAANTIAVRPAAAGADVDVTIGDISAASSITGPTVVYGSVTVAGETCTAATSIIGPTVTTGGIDVTIGDISAATSITGPTVAFGSITISGETCSAATSITGPTVVYGSVTVDGGTCSAVSSITGPSVAVGGVNVTIGDISAASSITGPTVTFGSLAVTIGDVSAATSITGPTILLGSLTVEGGTCSATSSIVGPSVSTGGVDVTIGDITAATSITGPDVSTSEITVEIGDVAAASSIDGPTIALGSLTLSGLIATAATSITGMTTGFEIATCRLHRVPAETRIHRVPAQQRIFVLTCDDVK